MLPGLHEEVAMPRALAPCPSHLALADRIRIHHRKILQDLRVAAEDAWTAGELLVQAKEFVPHGTWLSWIERNCGFSHHIAERYMRIARRWGEMRRKLA
jgi:Protein of unknown function (DUF3102)